MGATAVTYVVGRYWQAELTGVITNDICVPSSHNILLYEDGHAVVADFGGRIRFAVFYEHKKDFMLVLFFFHRCSSVPPRHVNIL